MSSKIVSLIFTIFLINSRILEQTNVNTNNPAKFLFNKEYIPDKCTPIFEPSNNKNINEEDKEKLFKCFLINLENDINTNKSNNQLKKNNMKSIHFDLKKLKKNSKYNFLKNIIYLGEGEFNIAYKYNNLVIRQFKKNLNEESYNIQLELQEKLENAKIANIYKFYWFENLVFMDFYEEDFYQFIFQKNNSWDFIELLNSFNSLKYDLNKIHEKGFTHGDLKPENILVNEDKKIKFYINDFDFVTKEFDNKSHYKIKFGSLKNYDLVSLGSKVLSDKEIYYSIKEAFNKEIYKFEVLKEIDNMMLAMSFLYIYFKNNLSWFIDNNASVETKIKFNNLYKFQKKSIDKLLKRKFDLNSIIINEEQEAELGLITRILETISTYRKSLNLIK